MEWVFGGNDQKTYIHCISFARVYTERKRLKVAIITETIIPAVFRTKTCSYCDVKQNCRFRARRNVGCHSCSLYYSASRSKDEKKFHRRDRSIFLVAAHIRYPAPLRNSSAAGTRLRLSSFFLYIYIFYRLDDGSNL